MNDAQQCNGCRFWLVDTKTPPGDAVPHAFGRCRRYPPTISDHMASIAIGTPGFGEQVDSDELARTVQVYQSGLLPATFFNEWCGEFAEVAA